MASTKYTINWTDDTLKGPFDIPSKTTDTSHSSLTLIGIGSKEWGQEYQENLIHILENFASNSKPPKNPTVGQMWFNSGDNYLKVYGSGEEWVDLKRRSIDSMLPPTGELIPGDLWYDSGKGQLKVYLNEGMWSDPMSGDIQTPKPIPVPAPAGSPTPASPVAPTPFSPGSIPTPAPVAPTPSPTVPGNTPAPSPLPATYNMPSHRVEYYGPEFVWGLNGGMSTTDRVPDPVPQILANTYPQLTVSNEGVLLNDITKMLNGTDGVHRDWDYTMSISTAKVVIVGSFGYRESKTSGAGSMTESQWIDALTQVVQTAKKYNKIVILVSMHTVDPSFGRMSTYALDMAGVASSTGVGYIEMVQYTASNFTGNLFDWLPDGLTPNQNGYNVIGQRVASQYPILYKQLSSIDVPAPTPTGPPKPFGQDAALYPTLTFQEEFDGTALSSSVWSIGNWFEASNGLSNYAVSNGSLIAWVVNRANGTLDQHNFTCTTDGAFYQKFGYFEVEAKMPYGSGVWPAFWMYCHDDSTRPEIVFMETWPSAQADFYGDTNLHARSYVASAINPSATSIGERKLLGSLYNDINTAPDLSASFHKYGVRWDSSGIQFYFDGQAMGSKLVSSVMTYRMFFVIDLWIGGLATAPDSTIASTQDRGMVVNYFRAWALNDGTTEVSGSLVTPTPVPTPGSVPTPTTPVPAPIPTPTPAAPPTPTPSTVQPFGQSGSYTLTFSDEFESGSLDFTKWNDHIWYQGSDPTINYAQQNGSLLIWPASGFVNRTIDTDGKFSQVYGFFEIEAKLPYGKGPWPAFWLYAHNDAAGNKARPEIDIMEAYPGGGPNSGWSDSNLHPTNYGVTLHMANVDYSYHDIPYTKKLTDVMSATDLSAAYHKYGVKWESNGITFYFDGQVLGSKWMDTTSYFNQPMYVLLDLWFGSASGSPDGSTPTGKSNSFDIRYVRVWSFGSVPAPTPTPAPIAPPAPVPTPLQAPAPTPVAPAPVPSPTPISVTLGSQFHVGMHAHRLYNGGTSPEPQFNYGLIRDWDIEGLHDAAIWFSDGSINTSLVEQVYMGHARHGARVLKCFGSVPQWAARRPNEYNYKYPSYPGSLSGPADLDAYQTYCFDFIFLFRSYLFAVEGWNEPFQDSTSTGDFTTMTATQLADVQKRLWTAAKMVDPNLPVFSPPQAYWNGIPSLLQAKTSQGEPIHKFFDVLSWHAYNFSANGNAGPNYANQMALVKSYMTNIGISKPLADTEHGWLPNNPGGSAWGSLSSDAKGRVLYDTAKAARDIGVVCVCYYSYDDGLMGHPDTDPVVASWMGNAYKDLDTRWGGTPSPFPAPTATPIPTVTPSPTTPSFSATVSSAPADGTSISGTATIKIVGSGIVNAELVPANAYTPVYGKFTVASDGTSATLSFNTAQLSNGAYTMRVLAWNVPAGATNGQEITAMPARTWTIQNAGSPVPTPAPTVPAQPIIVDYYGDSTIYGVDGAGGGRVAQPAPAVFASLLVNVVQLVRNEGVSGTNSTQLLNGTDGVHPTWDTQMSNSNATHVIVNHAINDWQLNESQYKANLQQLITIARNHGKKPILETPNPTYQALSGGNSSSDQEVANKAQYMREVGFAMNVGVIDQFQMLTDYVSSHGLTARDLCPDGLHPTQSVYTLKGQYAASLAPTLR